MERCSWAGAVPIACAAKPGGFFVSSVEGLFVLTPRRQCLEERVQLGRELGHALNVLAQYQASVSILKCPWLLDCLDSFSLLCLTCLGLLPAMHCASSPSTRCAIRDSLKQMLLCLHGGV